MITTRKPSIKTLARVFPDNAKAARAILDMSHAELKAVPVCADMIRAAYNPPAWYSLRLAALNECGGFHGVECAESTRGEYLEYLNAGDSYAATLLYWRGRYSVATVGDFIETMERGRRARFN